MKRGVLFAALGMTVAGVASANVFTAVPHGVASPPQAREAAPTASRASPSEVVKPAPKSVAAAPVVQKPSVEMRQAPVPLQVKPRPPVNLPAVEAKATEAKPGEAGATQEAAGSSDGINEIAAKAAIEADGYKGVKVVRKGANGAWHAKALRGKTEVLLTVDASGSVSAN